VRGGDLLDRRYRRSCEDARLFLEGLDEEVEAPRRAAWRKSRGAALRGTASLLTRSRRSCAWRRRRAHEPRTSGARSPAAHVEATAAAVQVFSVRDGKVVAREGLPPRPPLNRAGTRCCLDPPAVSTPFGAATYLAELPPAGDIPDVSCSRRGSPPAADGPAHRQSRCPPAGGEAAPSSSSPSTRGSVSSSSGSTRGSSRRRFLRSLRDLADLEVEPSFECFDILEHPGLRHRGLDGGLRSRPAEKSDYRKFRVKGVSGGADDFASMREVVGPRTLQAAAGRGEGSCPTSSDPTAARASSGRRSPPSGDWACASPSSRWRSARS